MLTLLIGNDWLSNRNAIFERIAEAVHQNCSGQVLMVPELISHDSERRLCQTAGDSASRYAEVLSFTRLAKRVSETVGHSTMQCLDDGGRIVAMASAVQQVQSRLKAYAAVGTKPEFFTGMVDIIDEFKRCCISSKDILDASAKTTGSLAQKLEELALIMEAYDGICMHGKRDPRDQMSWLLEELETSTYAQEHTFYVDGFPDFTRQHMAILEHIIRYCPNVTISLNCDAPDSKKAAFEKPGDTAVQFIQIAHRFHIPYEIIEIEARNDKLSTVRDHLFGGSLASADQEALSVFRADTAYNECVEVAQRILNLVHNGARFNEISVVYSDLGVYHNPLSILFKRCHIPFYLSGTEDILEKPIMATVVSALETALGGFEQKDVLRYLRTMLSPLSMQDCDILENYVVMWGITGNQWLKRWGHHPKGLGDVWSERDHQKLAILNQMRQKSLQPLAVLRDSIRNAKNAGEMILAVYAFLEDIDLTKRLARSAAELEQQGDNRNVQILNQLWDILITALEQMYDVLSQSIWEPDSFSRLLKLLLSQYDVGTIPASLDCVVMGSVSSMRCQQSKYLFVLGALEGAIPSFSGTTGVLSEQDRQILKTLGVPLTGGSIDGLQNEFFEIYGVFCGATQSVTVSCPDGQESFVYRRLKAMALEEKRVCAGLGAALADPVEAAAYFARYSASETAKKMNLSEHYESICRAKKYQIGNISRNSVEGLYGSVLNLSASQVDRQADCALAYFLRYGLRAKERKPITIDPAEFGTYVHAVLENTVADVVEKGGFQEVSIDEVLNLAREHSDAYARERFSQIDSDRLRYLFNRNAQELELIVIELWKELRESEFAPKFFELAFGEDGALPAIDVPEGAMPAKLCGFIDRVDVWQRNGKQYFRIVDYKTGKKSFDYCDVFNGLGLQMLLYLFALEMEGSELIPNGVASGVQYFPARAPLVSADDQLTQEEVDAAREKLWKRKGLLLSDEEVLYAMEPEEKPRRLSYTRKKDGSISGDIADAKQFGLLNKFVFSCLRNMVNQIANGSVTPNPYTRGNSHNACWFCPYGKVCHSEYVENRRNYKTMSAERFWEDVEKKVTGDG